MLFLGIDTSNYTTSACLVKDGVVIANEKSPLPVKEGMCGLRQSDALFAHIKNLPELVGRIQEKLAGQTPDAIGVSEKPRNREGSYMPCFLAGVAAAESMAAVLGVPLYRFSHQCGHLRAALYSAGKNDLIGRPFGAFHISGGTTEMLYVTPKDNGFCATIVGGTKDLNAGQLIDRIGVALGLSFPCGPALEESARQNQKRIPRRKVKTEDGYIHLSGLENLAMKLFEDTGDAPLCAAFVLQYITDAVVAMSEHLRNLYGASLPIVYAGGVMSDSIIRQGVQAKIKDAYFAAPAFSADNAAGIALLAAEQK